MEKVEAQPEYEVMHRDRDPLRLLEVLRSIMFHNNSRRSRNLPTMNAIKPGMVTQTRYMKISAFLKKSRAKLEVLTFTGGEIFWNIKEGMLQDELERIEANDLATSQQF